jgi:hypothetical protein
VSIAVITPWTDLAASQAGTRWWKRLLPVGEINYKGRILKFTPEYLTGLVEAFRDKAYDQVPFQLAPDNNSHTNDPERTRGLISEMQLRRDGLWVALDPTEAGDAVLRANPGLGVSARIVEDYDRADGKFFPRAIQHVLGTLDPRIPALGGWEAVAAANDAEFTYDLSNETWKEFGMPDLTDEQNAKLAKLLDLDPDKLNALVATLEPGTVGALNGGEGGGAGDGGAGDGGEDDLDQIAAYFDSLTDEELAQLERELEEDEAGSEPEPAGAGLSGEAAMAIELAQAQGDENARQLGIISAQLDAERWANERARLVGSGGVPPFIADLAQPLLEGTGHVVDLANGKSVDAGQVTRKILTEVGKMFSHLGLQAGVELGTEMDEPGDAGAEEARAGVVARARQQMFGLS